MEHYKSINWFELLTKATDENKGNLDVFDDNSWNFSVQFKKQKQVLPKNINKIIQ